METDDMTKASQIFSKMDTDVQISKRQERVTLNFEIEPILAAKISLVRLNKSAILELFSLWPEYQP